MSKQFSSPSDPELCHYGDALNEKEKPIDFDALLIAWQNEGMRKLVPTKQVDPWDQPNPRDCGVCGHVHSCADMNKGGA
jgi:hypothetical protein